MRNMLLMIGVPGAGKDTWIKSQGIKLFSVAPDDVRFQISAPVLTTGGVRLVSMEHEKEVWDIVKQMVLHRLQYGDFVVINATHVRRDYINMWIKMAKEYRYRVWYKLLNPPLEVLLERNKNRGLYKYVPEDVVKLYYARLQSLKIPSGITPIETVADMTEKFKWYDVNGNYKNIWVIGDIHGVLRPLDKFINKYYNDKDLFIFLGDYFDRGQENYEVFNLMEELSFKKNVLLVEGNHEEWAWWWATNHYNNIKSPLFKYTTQKQWEEKAEDLINFKKRVRQFIRKIRPYYSFRWNDLKIIFTHGGVSHWNLSFISAYQVINGVGDYEEYEEVAHAFLKNRGDDDSIIQIFGHRNTNESPIKLNEANYLLENHMAEGGTFRFMRIGGKNDIKTFEWNCDYIYIPVWKKTDNAINKAFDKIEVKTVKDMIDYMEAHPLIQRKPQKVFNPNIVSYSFNKKAFYKGMWDKVNVKARGIFINVKTQEIVARAYNKFFNINERPETQWNKLLNGGFTFPVRGYIKYNGFLGITGYDSETNQVIYASKSSINSSYAKIFRDLLTDEQKVVIEEWVKKGYSLVFEVIHPEKDPHIIYYEKPFAVLLDVIKRDIEPIRSIRLSYEELLQNFKDIFIIKELLCECRNKDELQYWYEYEFFLKDKEGVVLEDINGFMVKYKTSFYKRWKEARKYLQKYFKYHYVETTTMFDVEIIRFFDWIKKQDFNKIRGIGINIPKLRNMYLKSKEVNNE